MRKIKFCVWKNYDREITRKIIVISTERVWLIRSLTFMVPCFETSIHFIKYWLLRYYILKKTIDVGSFIKCVIVVVYDMINNQNSSLLLNLCSWNIIWSIQCIWCMIYFLTISQKTFYFGYFGCENESYKIFKTILMVWYRPFFRGDKLLSLKRLPDFNFFRWYNDIKLFITFINPLRNSDRLKRRRRVEKTFKFFCGFCFTQKKFPKKNVQNFKKKKTLNYKI